MIRQLLEEVKAAPLDEASRNRLKEIHQASIKELEAGLAPELVEELERLTLPFTDEGTPSEGELRIAQAQLVGWLEGLFHGIQTAIYAQQMAARAQFEQMRRRCPPGMAPGAGRAPRPQQPRRHQPGRLRRHVPLGRRAPVRRRQCAGPAGGRRPGRAGRPAPARRRARPARVTLGGRLVGDRVNVAVRRARRGRSGSRPAPSTLLDLADQRRRAGPVPPHGPSTSPGAGRLWRRRRSGGRRGQVAAGRTGPRRAVVTATVSVRTSPL